MRLTRFAASILLLCCGLYGCGLGAGRDFDENRNSGPQSEKTAQRDAQKKPRAAVNPNKFAIVIAGVGGEAAYTEKFTTQALSLHDALTERLGFDEKHVFLLTEKPVAGPENALGSPARRATADDVRKAFEEVKAASAAEAIVLVVLIGHGSFDSQQAKFNLAGPDLTAKDYASALGSLGPRRVVFVNTASSSGEFVKPLSGENRIVITATRSGNEQNVTVFAEHFIAALNNPASDADKNNRVSVLEAFEYATRLTADWYKQNDRLASEHALIDDNGDGTGHEEAKDGDGVLAKTTYLDSTGVAQAGDDRELARLLGERQKLEESIEKLKARKGEMKPEEYDAELERLLVELATLNQTIKGRQK
ncbi:MAG TPA: hypothetical protein VJQ56_12780 [Blastocatellia bacterium]|nr:hypothetical protein [Blastocatellia bacterium]